MGVKPLLHLLGNNIDNRLYTSGQGPVWFNDHMMVRDDPNLRTYWGDYLLDELLEKNTLYGLNVNRRRIHVVGLDEHYHDHRLQPTIDFLKTTKEALLALHLFPDPQIINDHPHYL
ncbi:hypothetical protein CMO92_04200 [Candidatus Woesearchaeota archaeon]|nr:hypothetical protein [Candidatus Woesearchaeota archaeon]|tara:strand:+ start:692 stop:1039 length:348 start_codon:yes stop_codon:yes gene_type:complete